MQVYIIYFFNFVNQEALAQYLNSYYQIRNWYQYGNVLAVYSILTLAELQTVLNPFFFGQTFLILPAIGSYAAGNMPLEFWNFINNPKDSGRWPPLQMQYSTTQNQISENKNGDMPPVDFSK